MAEAVEEDEVARLRLRERDRLRGVPLRDRVVRQVDPELGVDVHDEAGAVEAARARAAPDVRDTDVPERDGRGRRVAAASAEDRRKSREAVPASLMRGCRG